MIHATINGIPVQVKEGTCILDAAKLVNITIPTLCKHPDLPPMASCGICVVKIKGTAKMPRACHTPVENGMEITTHDPEIVNVRRTVLELILSNHPNECLTCGRNGSCELQNLTAEFGIRSENMVKILRVNPPDDSTKAIVMEPRKCIVCGRCVNVCQHMQNVWALCFLQRSFKTHISPAGRISLNDSPCIHCGQCAAHCPTGALFEYDETQKVWNALQNSDKYCVVQIAPSVRVSIGEAFGTPPGTNLTNKLYSLLRRMGFKAVFDTNFGADVTIVEEASELVQRLKFHPEKLPLISSCCPAWVDFLEKFHSDIIDSFSTCKSPHAIVGVLAKTYYAEKNNIDPSQIFMVSIMPCTAKKYEIKRSYDMFASGQQDIDISITTRELSRMIKQSGINFLNLPDEQPDNILGDYSGAGTIFGVTGGMMEAALRSAQVFLTGNKSDIKPVRLSGLKGVKEGELNINGQTLRVAVAHGMSNIESVLNKVRKAKQSGEPSPYQMIEVMACPGGCIGGGGQPYGITDEIRMKRIEGLYQDDERNTVYFSHENPHVKKLYEQFLQKPLSEKAHHLLHTSYQKQKEYKK